MEPLNRIEQDFVHGMDSVPKCRSMLKNPLILYCDSRSSILQRGSIDLPSSAGVAAFWVELSRGWILNYKENLRWTNQGGSNATYLPAHTSHLAFQLAIVTSWSHKID